MNPVIPMSVLSGAPSREDIKEYLDSVKSVGIEQIMLYPRKGCEIEYMSAHWEQTIGELLEELDARNMRVWLNDDFYFPSGNADRKVTAVNEYCLKSVTVRGENKGKRNLPDDLTPQNRRFADVLCPDAVRMFIRESHEWYYKKFGKYFGNIIAGFYTDEPSVLYYAGGDDIPYYTGIEDDYRLRFGRDFDADLMDEYRDFQKNALEVIGERFKNTYPKLLSDWCRAHSVVMTGHLLEDQSPMAAVMGSGSLPKTLPEFMLPGIDEISTDMAHRTYLTLLGAADYAKTDIGAMAEIFALGPVDMSWAKERCMVYMCGAFGINHYFYAISHMNFKGNRIVNNFFNHFGAERPDFEAMKIMTEESGKAAEIAKISFDPEVYVKYPARLYADRFTERRNSRIPEDKPFTDLINGLSKYQIQWRYIEEDDVSSYHHVIEQTEDGYVLDGKKMELTEIISALAAKPLVTDSEGKCPDGIFVRKLRDGRVIVMNYNGAAGEYTVCGKKVYIPEYGVVISDEICKKKKVIREDNRVKFDIKYYNGNFARLMYLNDETKAVADFKCDVKAKFYVREECKAEIDGTEIQTSPCSTLGKGFDILYNSSETMDIKAREHTVVSGNDYKYLPSVMIEGDFKSEYVSGDICRAIIAPRDTVCTAGQTVTDHGKVGFSYEADIPEGTEYIELKCESLYTELLIDGKSAGKCAYAPYVYRVPAGTGGKCRIEIIQYSSLGSMFGDTDYFNYHQDVIRWRSTKPSHPAVFGIDSIQFLGE